MTTNAPVQVRRPVKSNAGPADRTFRGALRGGALVLVVMVLVGTFLGYRAWKALHKAGLSFLTAQDWNPTAASSASRRS